LATSRRAAAAIAAATLSSTTWKLGETLEGDRLDALVARADVVLDCCDNFATRQAINAACVAHRKPLISGAAIRFDAQLALYDVREADSPCYACVFAPDTPPEETQCATLGVLAPLTGIVGSMQATIALNLLAGVGPVPIGQLQMLDARCMEWSSLQLRRNPHCAVCGPLRAAPA